jgi:Winged helix DNA-binding domain
MNHRDIACMRMRVQRLWADPFARPADVVRWLGAMQSQEFGLAKWSVGQRTTGSVEADVERVFAGGAILRTHVLRPTWHFVTADDIRWLLRLTAPRVHALNAYHYRRLELDGGLFARSNAVIREALAGGRNLTRKEIGTELERAGIAADGVRLGYILIRAELDAVVCSGPRRGKQHTYALLDERAPNARSLDPDDALLELVTRYFASRGPATARDFAWWSSLTVAETRRGLAMAGPRLERREVDGRTYWFDPSAAESRVGDRTPRMDLVPCYDEIVVAYGESRDVLQGNVAALERAAHPHAVLRDGRLVGKWRTAEGRGVTVEALLHRPPSRAEAAGLEEAVERFGRFRDAPATLRLHDRADAAPG